MIEIRTTAETAIPSVAVCHGGNISLFLPVNWDINEGLAYCEQELLSLLHQRFKTLFANRDFPRVFHMAGEWLVIKPDPEQLPNHEEFFDKFFDT